MLYYVKVKMHYNIIIIIIIWPVVGKPNSFSHFISVDLSDSPPLILEFPLGLVTLQLIMKMSCSDSVEEETEKKES